MTTEQKTQTYEHTLEDKNPELFSRFQLSNELSLESYKKRDEIEIPNGPLTMGRAKKIVSLAFPLSQGSDGALASLFGCVHALHPDWKMDDEFKNTLAKIIKGPLSQKVVQQSGQERMHVPIARSGYERENQHFNEEFDRLLDSMQGILNDPNIMPHIPLDYSCSVESSDHKWLVEEGGRPRRTPEIARSPYEDPFMSFGAYFGIEMNLTGVPEYDHLFLSARRWLVDSLIYKHSSALEVAEVYLQHHPEKREFYESRGLLNPAA